MQTLPAMRPCCAASPAAAGRGAATPAFLQGRRPARGAISFASAGPFRAAAAEVRPGSIRSQRGTRGHASHLDQALRLQVLRRSHQLPCCPASWSAWSGPTAAASPTSSTPCAGCWANRKASELRGESMQDVIFNGSDHAQAGRPRRRRTGVRQRRRPRRRPVEPVRRDRRQARADARRHLQLLHQQPAGAPPRRAGRVPRHRPGPARLRDHRPGHDQPDHRVASPRSCACSSKKPRASPSTRSAGARPRTACRTRART